MYEKSSQLGNAEATFILGHSYHFGKECDKDIEKAMFYYQKGVEMNDMHCMHFLAELYEKGEDVKQDMKKAVELYEKAINLGNTFSMNNLGLLLQNGIKVEKDTKRAIKLFEDSFELGNPQSLYFLGVLFHDGKEVPKDIQKAIEYYNKSIEIEKNTKSMINLGIIYKTGDCVEKNMVKAISLFEFACNQGDIEAMELLGSILEQDRFVKKDLPKALGIFLKAIDLGSSMSMYRAGMILFDLKDYSNAFKYFDMAWKNGNSDSRNNLAILYQNGYGVKKNLEKAIELFELSAKENDDFALNRLGMIYLTEKKDGQKAKYYFEKSSLLGNSDSSYNLAFLYHEGRYLKQDIPIAIQLYETSIQKFKNTRSMVNLGYIYQLGFGVKKDVEKTVKFYQMAVDLGDSHAMCILGLLYQDGKEVKQDIQKCIQLYESAISLNNPDGMYNLALLYHEGTHVKRDIQKSIKLYEKSLEYGNISSLSILGQIYYLEHDVEKDIKKSIDYYEKAIEYGIDDQYVYYNLGSIYLSKSLGYRNPNKAFNLFEKSMKLGHLKSMNNLALMYEKGEGVEKNIEKSLELYFKAIKLGNVDALNNLGHYYFSLEKYEDALSLYLKAISLGDSPALNNLAIMYFQGKGVDKDINLGIELYKKAVALKNTTAMNNLGKIYLFGEGVDVDLQKAKVLYQESARLGDSEAIISLIEIERKLSENESKMFVSTDSKIQKEFEIIKSKERFYTDEKILIEDLNIFLENLETDNFEHLTYFNYVYSKLSQLDFARRFSYKNKYLDIKKKFENNLKIKGVEEKEISKMIHEMNKLSLIKTVNPIKINLESHWIDFKDIKIYFDIIGKGGYSFVYKGSYKNLPVAIKEIELKSDGHKESFFKEIEVLLRFNYEYILKCYGWTQKDNRYYLILELMEEDLLSRNLYLGRCEKLEILLKIAEGMYFLHQNGIYHRDLKCTNVLLNGDKVKISDFGLSHLKSNDSLFNLKSYHETETVKGTAVYMAPECLIKGLSSFKSDVYSFGMIIYTLFEKKEPDIVNKDDQKPEIIELNLHPEINEDIKLLMISCWNKDPEKRPSFEGIIEELDRILYRTTSVYGIKINL